MKLAYVSCIGQEDELIGYNLIYYYNLGIREFYIMFNNSGKTTQRIVDKFLRSKPDIYYRLFVDKDPSYKQRERLTMMANAAYNHGCDWIIPIDTDEIIKLTGYSQLITLLKEYDSHEYVTLKCTWTDYMATSMDYSITPKEKNYFILVKYKEDHPRPQSKIIVKWKQGMKFGFGHHCLDTIKDNIIEIPSNILDFAHFADRNKKQFIQKRKQIGLAFISEFGRNSKHRQVVEYKTDIEDGVYFKNRWESLCQDRKDNFDRYIYDPIDEDLFL